MTMTATDAMSRGLSLDTYVPLDSPFGELDSASSFTWDSLAANAFTPINESSGASTSARTVSPKDIFNDPSSEPQSTAFTNLTTPDLDLNDSPYGVDSYQTSPMFQDSGDFGGQTDPWFSLFPDSGSAEQPPADSMERSVSHQSVDATSNSSSSANSPIILDAANRRKSSATGSPALLTVAAVTKPRRRKGPLPPIAVDPSDKVALKRARNTLAARDSRARKYELMAQLERQKSELQDENTGLRAENEKLKRLLLEAGITVPP